MDRTGALRPAPNAPLLIISFFGILWARFVPWSVVEEVRKKALSSARERKLLQGLLRTMRIEAGLRQTDMASRLRQPQSFISKYESGERRLDILQLRAVSAALGMSLTDFVKRLERVLARSERS